jgi:hypothetical protein
VGATRWAAYTRNIKLRPIGQWRSILVDHLKADHQMHNRRQYDVTRLNI